MVTTAPEPTAELQKPIGEHTIGVPEFWRFNGKVWRIYQLQDGDYAEVESSPTFPQVPKERLYSFLEQAKDDEIAATLSLRAWFELYYARSL